MHIFLHCREAFALLSSTHPLVPSQLMGELKKSEAKERPKKRGQVTFKWKEFDNPGRSDGLKLKHWVKCYKDAATGKVAPAEKEYAFSKYNKSTKIFRYDDDEWNTFLAADSSWSREETDYLLDLVESLDMRWLAIADRYSFPGGQERSMEDIKARYYSVSRQLLLGREGGPDAVANHPLIKHPYNAQHEKERKRGLELLMARTPEQDAEEDIILAEAAKIEAKRKAETSGRRGGAIGGNAGGGGGGGLGGAGASGAPPPMVEVSEFETEPPVGTLPLFDMQGNPALPTPAAEAPADAPLPRVIARSSHTRELINQIFNGTHNNEKTQKMLQGSMAELKLADLPRAASRQVCGAYLALVREVTEHLDLKRQLAARQALVGAKRAANNDAGDMDGSQGGNKRQRTARKQYEG
jgi:DNA methyltransferase 1-associated protein 1